MSSPSQGAIGFDDELIRLLKFYENDRMQLHFQGPWNAILNIIFPASQGYMVVPVKEIATSDLYFDIALMVNTYPQTPHKLPGYRKTHLYVEFRSETLWPHGVARFEAYVKRELEKRADQSTQKAIYWITSVGSHWRYGKVHKKEYRPLGSERLWVPLIGWQHTIHDKTSFQHLRALAREVGQS